MRHGRTRRVRNNQVGAEADTTTIELSPEAVINTAVGAVISGLTTALVVNKLTKGLQE